MTLNQLTIAEARDALRAGDVTASDLTHACLSAIDAGSPLNAFVHKTPDIALAQAEAALYNRDQELAAAPVRVLAAQLGVSRGVVVDAYQRVYGHPGLHIADGAAISANLGVNPSLTRRSGSGYCGTITEVAPWQDELLGLAGWGGLPVEVIETEVEALDALPEHQRD